MTDDTQSTKSLKPIGKKMKKKMKLAKKKGHGKGKINKKRVWTPQMISAAINR